MLASNSIDSDTLSKHWPFCAIKQSTHQLLFAVKTCAYYIGKKIASITARQDVFNFWYISFAVFFRTW